MSKTIEHIKDRIQFYKTSKIEYEKNCIKHHNKEIYEKGVEVCEELIEINEQIKSELEVLQILTKCIRVSIISYDDNDMSKTAYDYSLETDQLTTEEFNILDNYCKSLGVCDE